MNNYETHKYAVGFERAVEVRRIITEVVAALKEKGYNPVNQLVGYLLSGDPTYITNYNGARGMISRLERDELLEAIICEYIGDYKN